MSVTAFYGRTFVYSATVERVLGLYTQPLRAPSYNSNADTSTQPGALGYRLTGSQQ